MIVNIWAHIQLVYPPILLGELINHAINHELK